VGHRDREIIMTKTPAEAVAAILNNPKDIVHVRSL
jgi:hypothetical protein